LRGTPVAVKELFFEEKDVLESFHHEVGILSSIRHPNILLFLGASVSSSRYIIITEYIYHGSLRNFLEINTIRWKQVLNMSISIARGMAWLHGLKPEVLHRDLHSKNILVADATEGVCKISDFGLSRITNKKYKESTRLYERIKPPEVRKNKSNHVKASDVFHYGLVLLEIFTSRKAISSEITVHIKKSPFAFKNDIGRKEFEELIQICCEENLENRRCFHCILEILESITHMKKEEKQNLEKQQLRKSNNNILLVNIDENENRTEVIVNADGNSFDIQNKEGKKRYRCRVH